ncbi:MAG: hypothetical protein A2902_03795 [Elusimicrobia bacterium RIFCSPLOWO2_01_FULL_64_13]|nr:MAG: hypothetical protein A2636_03435 [Elusimicrobia bacterium RIFCSPHIGHO2_01_FULL_64_10]OGR97758.1 MAG: hypothetical protein A2902_03795 [Elusimicrobia bacterium RIFCSPLOWO2_01_FULL_64_13]
MAARYAFFCGSYFALVQFGFFFVLEANLSSAGLTYLAVTCSWLLGSFFGLRLEKRKAGSFEAVLGLGSALAFYAVALAVKLFPFDNSFLWLYSILTACGGLYAGTFFNANGTRFKRVKDIFFWENNGFICGILGTFLGVSFLGIGFLYAAPGLAAGLLLVIKKRLRSEEEREEDFRGLLDRFSTKI